MATSIVFRTMTPKADWLGCTFNVIPLSGNHPKIVFHFATSKLDLLANTYMTLGCTGWNALNRISWVEVVNLQTDGLLIRFDYMTKMLLAVLMELPGGM